MQPYEADDDVIDAAGDRQLMHLRTYLQSVHHELAQRLIDEVTEARICLMNVEQRNSYNQRLRDQEPPQVSPVATVTAADPLTDLWDSGELVTEDPTIAPSARLRWQRDLRIRLIPWAALALIVIVGLQFFLNSMVAVKKAGPDVATKKKQPIDVWVSSTKSAHSTDRYSAIAFRNSVTLSSASSKVSFLLDIGQAYALFWNGKLVQRGTEQNSAEVIRSRETNVVGSNEVLIVLPKPKQGEEDQFRLRVETGDGANNKKFLSMERDWEWCYTVAHTGYEIPESEAVARLHNLDWEVLRPQSAEAEGGTKLVAQQNGSLLATNGNPIENIYKVISTSDLPTATGIRLEALTHPSLPTNGPGRNINGNYVLAEVVLAIDSNGTMEKVAFKEANATVEQRGGFRAPVTIDGRLKGSDKDGWGWAIVPHTGKPQTLFIEFTGPVSLKDGSQILIDLHHHYGPGGSHTLGCFRLSLTSDEFPTTKELRKLRRFEEWHPAYVR